MTGKLQSWWYRNIWNPNIEARNFNGTVGGWTFDELFGSKSSSGRTVGYDSSLTLSAVFRAMTLKGGILSFFPFQVFRKEDKKRVLVSDHNVSKMFSGRINDKYTKAVYLDRSVQHLEGWGNHVSLITRNGIGRVEKIDIIHPKDVQAFETDSTVVYKIKNNDPVPADRIIHVPNTGDGVWGKSTLGKAREDLSGQLEIRDYETGIFEKGGIPVTLFLPKDGVNKVTNEQRAELVQAWNKAKFSNRAVALPVGWDHKQMSLPPEDMAMIQSKEFGVSDVARWFGVPPQKLADLSRATFNNVEHMGIEFLQDTMGPLAKKYELEYTTKLFQLPSEEDFYLEFNIDAYLRADSVAKAEALTRLVAGGLRTPNEGRELDNYEPKEGGDDLMIQSATVPIRMLQTLMLSKTPQQRQSLRKKIEKQLNDGIDPQLIIEGLFQRTNGKHN